MMKHSTFFALVCVVSVSVNTLVVGTPTGQRYNVSSWKNLTKHQQHDMDERGTAILEKLAALRKLEKSDPTKDVELRDMISDLIWYLLGLTVGAFLDKINRDILRLSQTIETGVGQINAIIAAMDDATKSEINQTVTTAITEAVKIITPIIENLSKVLPNLLSPQWAPTDASDIIYALLGMTLEDFLIQITIILEDTDELLTTTINQLKQIADKVNDPTTKEGLLSTSDEYLGKGKAIILPVLSNLLQVLPSI